MFCETPLAAVFGAAPASVQDRYLRMYGIRLYWGDTEITVAAMLAVLAGVTVVFLLLSALRLRGYRKG